MAYREFRNEKIYDKPNVDWGFMQQAAQHIHDNGMLSRRQAADKQAADKKEASDIFDEALKNKTEHSDVSQRAAQSIREGYSRILADPNDTEGRRLMRNGNIMLKESQGYDDRNKALAAQIQERQKDPTFNYAKAVQDLNTLKSTKYEDLSSAYGKVDFNTPDYFNNDANLDIHTKQLDLDNKTNKRTIAAGPKYGFSKETTTEFHAPYTFTDGKDANGTPIVNAVLNKGEAKKYGHVDEYLSSNPLVEPYYASKINDKDVEKKMDELNRSIQKDNEKAIANGNPNGAFPLFDKTKDFAQVKKMLIEDRIEDDIIDRNKKRIYTQVQEKRVYQAPPSDSSRSSKSGVGITNVSSGTNGVSYAYNTKDKATGKMVKRNGVTEYYQKFANDKPFTTTLGNIPTAVNDETDKEEKLVGVEDAVVEGVRPLLGTVTKSGAFVPIKIRQDSGQDNLKYIKSLDNPKKIDELAKQYLNGNKLAYQPVADVQVKQSTNDQSDYSKLTPDQKSTLLAFKDKVNMFGGVVDAAITDPDERKQYYDLLGKSQSNVVKSYHIPATNIPSLSKVYGNNFTNETIHKMAGGEKYSKALEVERAASMLNQKVEKRAQEIKAGQKKTVTTQQNDFRKKYNY